MHDSCCLMMTHLGAVFSKHEKITLSEKICFFFTERMCDSTHVLILIYIQRKCVN